ncbi:recombinase family protein [Sinorhizobium psoraleae]|uniref:Recombinase family protein n=1 Tax=Sinorhizobium psoraleae TaxID=520838 RepID=A0ABT4KF79_9HYPH|nr:recombinase family protein [Sinorhizobium psoraleae]MCZ4090623.1 recombinase family protein [Sinorhizobium psoraleae]
MKFVAYYRVSTKRQGRSGLGLDAQRAAIEAFLTSGRELLAEFTDVTSGKRDERAELNKAIKLARSAGAKLLIAKLDRFSRRVSFIARMMESDVGLTIAEMPNATEFQLHIFAALAQEERRLISERTRKALAQAKTRGVQLGTYGRNLAERNKADANSFARKVFGSLPEGWQEMSYCSLANALNASGLKTRSGGNFIRKR